jgi:peptidoglycan/xylan/chitin deacetylase (PgdA/CDA1 family)
VVKRDAGRLLVCFDFEGSYGMPHDVPYDIEASARMLLDVLARYQAKATFFVVGRLAEEHPQIVRALAGAGHEIGLHGYDHDNLAGYGEPQLARLDEDLARVESLVRDIAGAPPRCFRAPYLLAPRFYRPEVYALLESHGYRWVSNREVRYPVELLRPDRFPVRSAWRRRPAGSPRLARSPLLLAPLNAGLVMRETFGRSPADRLRWLLGPRAPFWRDGLVEVPLYAPLDCDLLGLPAPQRDTQPELLAYARAAVKAAAAASGPLAMVTFHDWIVSGGNRLVLLEDTLAAARDAGLAVSTVAANPHWLPGQPEGSR